MNASKRRRGFIFRVRQFLQALLVWGFWPLEVIADLAFGFSYRFYEVVGLIQNRIWVWGCYLRSGWPILKGRRGEGGADD